MKRVTKPVHAFDNLVQQRSAIIERLRADAERFCDVIEDDDLNSIDPDFSGALNDLEISVDELRDCDKKMAALAEQFAPA